MMVAPVRFVSVYRRALVLDIDDVELCERCDGTGEVSGTYGGDGYGDRCCALADYEGTCPDCRGHRLIHGWSGGEAMPAAVVMEEAPCAAGRVEGAAPSSGLTDKQRPPRPVAPSLAPSRFVPCSNG